jgi:tetratricopeptide (TPR) repeat protein
VIAYRDNAKPIGDKYQVERHPDRQSILKSANSPRRLHIGGQVRTPGWEVLDANPGPCVDHVANASDLRGFEDNSFEQIYASHVVEHFDYRDQLVETLKEWYRVLTPTGTLCVSVPDLDVLARLFVDRTLLSGQLRDLNGAVQYFDQAVAVEPNNSRPYCNRGLALKELGQLDAALSSFDQAIALNRDDAVAWYSRGNLYKERGVADQALACYERALAINPDFAQAHFNRGVLLQQTQQLDVALASYERAVAINPDYAEAYANRGLVLYALNRIDDALLSFDRAIAIKPDYAEVYVNRASVLRTNKRFE